MTAVYGVRAGSRGERGWFFNPFNVEAGRGGFLRAPIVYCLYLLIHRENTERCLRARILVEVGFCHSYVVRLRVHPHHSISKENRVKI